MANVNLDVAMESTSQEILEKVQNTAMLRVPVSAQPFYSISTGSEVTAIDVTGKGFVKGLVFGYSNQSTNATITVDGIQLFSVNAGTYLMDKYASLDFDFKQSLKVTVKGFNSTYYAHAAGIVYFVE